LCSPPEGTDDLDPALTPLKCEQYVLHYVTFLRHAQFMNTVLLYPRVWVTDRNRIRHWKGPTR
jgi:hypothetical protein